MIEEWGCVYTPLNNLTVLFQNKMYVDGSLNWNYHIRTEKQIRETMYMFTAWGGIGIASAVGYFVTFVRKGAEKIGDVSESWFGYKIMIPFYAYSAFLLVGTEGIIEILILILMLMGYFIYRRSFRLRKNDLIVIAFSLIPICANWAFIS